MVIFNLYTLVDGIFVAHYQGDTALASINVASPYVTTIFSIESYLRLDQALSCRSIEVQMRKEKCMKYSQ